MIIAAKLFLGFTVWATAYCTCPKCTGKWSRYHKTATGKPAVGRIIAVDPRVIRLGSHVRIQGLGDFHAEDTGSAIRGARVDVLMRTHKQAQRFGRKRVVILVTSKGRQP